MAVNQTPVSVVALALCLVCLMVLAFGQVAQAQSQRVAGSSPVDAFAFDLPEQSLGDALDAYSRVTGISVLIDSANARRGAPAVRGVYTARDALTKLLADSNLHALYTAPQSVVLQASAEPNPAAPQAAEPLPRAVAAMNIPGAITGGRDYRAYIAGVQATVQRALCRSPQTRPGLYRLALQLNVDAQGHIGQVYLLDTTGDAERDAAVLRSLQAADVGAPPAAAMPQPIAMLLLPEGPLSRVDCVVAPADHPGAMPTQAG